MSDSGQGAASESGLIGAAPSQVCCDSKWEEAYRRFQTPAEEVRKFKGRLRWAGVDAWDRDLRIAELFCGRGSGLVAWEQLGFRHLAGVDLSGQLLSEYEGPARCYVGDCRELPLEDQSQDVVIVQGGLHHLPTIPQDLQEVLDEMNRVLKSGGKVLIFEPWKTPFLDFVRWTCNSRLARKSWYKLDALATMIEHELETYRQWLARPAMILDMLDARFECQRRSIRLGMLRYAGNSRTIPSD